MITAILLISQLSGPPMPPGYVPPKSKPLSPKAMEQKASLGTAMLAPLPIILPGGFTIVELTPANNQVYMAWLAGTPPFQVESSSLDGKWTPVGTYSMKRDALFPQSSNQFFRVQGNVLMPLSATATNNSVTVSWQPPTFDMADNIDHYRIRRSASATGDTLNTPYTLDISQSPTLGQTFSENNPPLPSSYEVDGITATGQIIPSKVASLVTSVPGVPSWIKNFGGSGYDAGRVIVMDSDNNTYVGGFFAGTITVGGSTFTALGTQDFLLIKLDTNGTVVWKQHYGVVGGGFLSIRSMAIDSSRNLYVCGGFTGNANFGGATLIGTQSSNYDCFLVKYDSSGTHVWSIGFGGTGTDVAHSVKVSPAGAIYVGGEAFGGFTINDAVVPNTGAQTGFLIKLTTNGVGLWSHMTNDPQPIAANRSPCYAVGLDSNENVFFTGYTYPGTLNFGGGNLFVQAAAVYVAKYTSAGVYIWGSAYGKDDTTGTIDSYFSSTVDSSGDVIIGCGIQGSKNMGGGLTPFSKGFFDAYIGKYSGANGTYIASSMVVGSSPSDLIHTSELSCDAQNNIYYVGDFTGKYTSGPYVIIDVDKPDPHGFGMKFTSALVPAWANAILNTTPNGTSSVMGSVYAGSTIAMTALSSGPCSFGGVPYISNGGRDIVVFKVNP